MKLKAVLLSAAALFGSAAMAQNGGYAAPSPVYPTNCNHYANAQSLGFDYTFETWGAIRVTNPYGYNLSLFSNNGFVQLPGLETGDVVYKLANVELRNEYAVCAAVQAVRAAGGSGQLQIMNVRNGQWENRFFSGASF